MDFLIIDQYGHLELIIMITTPPHGPIFFFVQENSKLFQIAGWKIKNI
jgi:hypothetical protein